AVGEFGDTVVPNVYGKTCGAGTAHHWNLYGPVPPAWLATVSVYVPVVGVVIGPRSEQMPTPVASGVPPGPVSDHIMLLQLVVGDCMSTNTFLPAVPLNV